MQARCREFDSPRLHNEIKETQSFGAGILAFCEPKREPSCDERFRIGRKDPITLVRLLDLGTCLTDKLTFHYAAGIERSFLPFAQ